LAALRLRVKSRPAWAKIPATTGRENQHETSRQQTLLSVELRKIMKYLWLVILLLAAGCSDNSDNTAQSTNSVESANESANNQVETLLASRYSAISNWEKNLPRHGSGSVVFSIDVQKALTATSPILFRAHLHDVAIDKTNETTYAEFTQTYKSDASANSKDFILILNVKLSDDQAQKILSTPKDVFSDEYAVVAKITGADSSAAYWSVDDDWPTIYAEGKCVDFSLLK
jgi:hypothetical protein